MMPNTTSVPNVLFDSYLKELKTAELKVLLIIIRQTLGWSDKRAVLGRKHKDWISNSQLRSKTGSSRRAISSATEGLVSKQLIEVLDSFDNPLTKPSERKGKMRMYYRIAPTLLSPVDIEGKSTACAFDNCSTNANIAQDLRKKVADLTQHLRITKETLLN